MIDLDEDVMPSIEVKPPRLKPSAARALWWLIPEPVRRGLRARCPLDCKMVGNAEALCVSVGSGVPLRWLYLQGRKDGMIAVNLWEVREKNKEIASAVVASDALVMLLQTWIRDRLS